MDGPVLTVPPLRTRPSTPEPVFHTFSVSPTARVPPEFTVSDASPPAPPPYPPTNKL